MTTSTAVAVTQWPMQEREDAQEDENTGDELPGGHFRRSWRRWLIVDWQFLDQQDLSLLIPLGLTMNGCHIER